MFLMFHYYYRFSKVKHTGYGYTITNICMCRIFFEKPLRRFQKKLQNYRRTGLHLRPQQLKFTVFEQRVYKAFK